MPIAVQAACIHLRLACHRCQGELLRSPVPQLLQARPASRSGCLEVYNTMPHSSSRQVQLTAFRSACCTCHYLDIRTLDCFSLCSLTGGICGTGLIWGGCRVACTQ